MPRSSITTIASGTVSRIERSRDSRSRKASSAALRSLISRMIADKDSLAICTRFTDRQVHRKNRAVLAAPRNLSADADNLFLLPVAR